MSNPKRGEVWLVDLDLVAKVRPCLVLSVPVTPSLASARDSTWDKNSER